MSKLSAPYGPCAVGGEQATLSRSFLHVLRREIVQHIHNVMIGAVSPSDAPLQLLRPSVRFHACYALPRMSPSSVCANLAGKARLWAAQYFFQFRIVAEALCESGFGSTGVDVTNGSIRCGWSQDEHSGKVRACSKEPRRSPKGSSDEGL